MDIAGLSMDLASVSTMSKVSTAVLSKTMDTNEALGQGLVNMIDAAAMENSVNPAVGGNFDIRI
ncbi:MAG: YjfB family protein [Lachnospiraceae bacterium]|nr:YjfB family protein [Lachnospiraceae bacterium]MBP5223446.1 YjfB family protein [Lachnospiraceae bacterium]